MFKSFFHHLDHFWTIFFGPFLKSSLNFVTILLLFYVLSFFFFFDHEACEILPSQSGIELKLPALEGEVLITALPGSPTEIIHFD